MLKRTPKTLAAIACSSLTLMGVAAAQQNVPPVQIAPPGDTGRRITEDRLLTNYDAARGKAPAVLMLGGSVGGLGPQTNDAARAAVPPPADASRHRVVHGGMAERAGNAQAR
jgi:hypothetical protein